ncbi:hypothetical protein [Lysinibacillus capsici]|uniref:hypothetical protein n=1 Tax=Lysinibacillus capsici TaxID=2115968 RepID=UPI000E1FBD5F|nr:hypothetical protein [Lysinibacillus capsici]RDV25319.1 hypothetical protein C7B89_22810 [Lysinibacillus capsici]
MPSLKQSLGDKQHISKDDVCCLMSSTTITDELLQEIEVSLPRTVYCAPISIGQREFSITAQVGLKAQLVLIVDYDEYDGEKEVEYNRVKYSIYRTFVRSNGDIELYCEVRKGVN